MSEFNWVGRRVPRIDADGKVTGSLKFMTDLSFPNMLWGRVLRAKHPHALIKRIDTSRAEALPGVAAVLTHKDVPGLNGFGIAIPDQPVLCWDKVRMLGDAVTIVAAETPEIAEEALELIEVDYEPLPVVASGEEGLREDAPKVHADGNVIGHTRVKNGDLDSAFAQAAVVVENTYRTPRQMHAFLETEGGWGVPGEDGSVTIYCPAQYGYRDQRQLARLLGIPEEKIRIVSSPLGGAFGGKDEITVQHYLALLAFKTGRPVKIHINREESVVAGMKRHPMVVAMKTAATADGTLLAHEARIIGDTGAYASLGPAVLNLAIEHACGVYRIPSVDLEAWCVYTNNGIAGAMRGFGANQVIFAMESQMDLIAGKLGLCPLELRKKNAILQGELAGLGHTMEASVGSLRTLEALEHSDLWANREQYRAQASAPWKKRGIGIAASLHGCGLGVGLPDPGAATIELLPDGTFEVAVACEDIGQGSGTTFALVAAESLHCHISSVKMIQGDTARTLDSGTATASRTTYTGGRAITIAGPRMVDRLLDGASFLLGVPKESISLENCRAHVKDDPSRAVSYADIAAVLRENEGKVKVEGTFDWPTADKGIPGAFGLPHYIHSYMSQIVLVEVDTMTGRVEVLKTVSIPDAGRVINPLGLEGQTEGGAVMGAGYALTEDTVIENGQYKTKNLSTYIIPTSLDIPEIETVMVEELEESGPYGAKGIGEAVSIPITPAIANAIEDAVGVRLYDIPMTPERVYWAIQGKR